MCHELDDMAMLTALAISSAILDGHPRGKVVTDSLLAGDGSIERVRDEARAFVREFLAAFPCQLALVEAYWSQPDHRALMLDVRRRKDRAPAGGRGWREKGARLAGNHWEDAGQETQEVYLPDDSISEALEFVKGLRHTRERVVNW